MLSSDAPVYIIYITMRAAFVWRVEQCVDMLLKQSLEVLSTQQLLDAAVVQAGKHEVLGFHMWA